MARKNLRRHLSRSVQLSSGESTQAILKARASQSAAAKPVRQQT